MTVPYVGRFAPSPTGALHAGSLVAALASWLDARAHAGQWLVRVEDVDTTRCLPGLAETILQQLSACGLHSDAPVLYQSDRTHLYQRELDALIQSGQAYGCACSRSDIALALQRAGHTKTRHTELIYPGTCRSGLGGRVPRAWRFHTGSMPIRPLALLYKAYPATISIVNSAAIVDWHDRRLGAQRQNLSLEVGDFVLRRADACFAYQLAVVVDDAAQGITDVVRGEDLADNTARQILLQSALQLPTPRYLHTPLVLSANGEKLSKQNGAKALNVCEPLAALNQAAGVLGLSVQTERVDALGQWVQEWRAKMRVDNTTEVLA